MELALVHLHMVTLTDLSETFSAYAFRLSSCLFGRVFLLLFYRLLWHIISSYLACAQLALNGGWARATRSHEWITCVGRSTQPMLIFHSSLMPPTVDGRLASTLNHNEQS